MKSYRIPRITAPSCRSISSWMALSRRMESDTKTAYVALLDQVTQGKSWITDDRRNCRVDRYGHPADGVGMKNSPEARKTLQLRRKRAEIPKCARVLNHSAHSRP